MRSLEQVAGQHDIQVVAKLADEIWHEYFVSIIGRSQVDYMLDQFQSVPAITDQIENGQEYYLLKLDDLPAGYLSLVPDAAGDRVMISKLYVKKNFRGTGAGRYLLEFVLQQCKNRSRHSVWLTVNRHNQPAIEWYLKIGFDVTDEKKKDIGGGYFMDDFIMEMAVE
jgi:ribosomal protein S18 acetylase RimI-like enzyme